MTFGNEIKMVKGHFRLNSPKSQQDDMQDDQNLIESSLLKRYKQTFEIPPNLK